MRRVQCWQLVLCAVVLMQAMIAGCGPSLPQVEGIVTLDDQPLANARVVFQAPERPMAVATTDEDGWYTVRTGNESGMAAGTYQVAISAYQQIRVSDNVEAPLPKLRTPRIYNDASRSGLRAEIEEGSNRIDFHLSSQP